MSSAAPGMRLVWCALYLIRLCHMPNVHFVRVTNTTHREDCMRCLLTRCTLEQEMFPGTSPDFRCG
jgi:hypothetical protein